MNFFSKNINGTTFWQGFYCFLIFGLLSFDQQKTQKIDNIGLERLNGYKTTASKN